MVEIIQWAEPLRWSMECEMRKGKILGAPHPWHGEVFMLLNIYYSCNICLKQSVIHEASKSYLPRVQDEQRMDKVCRWTM